MCEVKYFICPMSTNIVDSIIEINSDKLGLLPSRRQIDYNCGYVNDWTTQTFANYVKNNSRITIERDHGGIEQGTGNEYESYTHDSKYFDIIHIDPWKKFNNFEDGIEETICNIKHIFDKNPQIKYEIGTEESIRPFTIDELNKFIDVLKLKLTKKQFENIQYLCIQSGVKLDIVNKKNIGIFNLNKLKTMIQFCDINKIKSKEHNGDYLSKEEIIIRFENGLDAINIGPEIAQIETEIYLDKLKSNEIDSFYEICYNSKKWEKWITDDFDLTNKEKLILICGHYNFNKLSNKDKFTKEIKIAIKHKLNELLNYI